MDDVQKVFGEPLVADPQIALKPFPSPPHKQGPLHKVQYVIEFVGPRSLVGKLGANLLSKQWHEALGKPNAFAMAPSDNEWRPLRVDEPGSLDSLAVSWDLITSEGYMSTRSADHLFGMAQQFAQTIQRRAIPLPPPADIDKIVHALDEFRESMDVGFTLTVATPTGSIEEAEIWKLCARLGLHLTSSGAFEWLAEPGKESLLSVTPLSQSYAFSMKGVLDKASYAGVGIGFSVPTSPSPIDSLHGCFHIAKTFGEQFGCKTYTEDDQALNPTAEKQLMNGLQNVVNTFDQAGIKPGSQEALKLFSENI